MKTVTIDGLVWRQHQYGWYDPIDRIPTPGDAYRMLDRIHELESQSRPDRGPEEALLVKAGKAAVRYWTQAEGPRSLCPMNELTTAVEAVLAHRAAIAARVGSDSVGGEAAGPARSGSGGGTPVNTLSSPASNLDRGGAGFGSAMTDRGDDVLAIASEPPHLPAPPPSSPAAEPFIDAADCVIFDGDPRRWDHLSRSELDRAADQWRERCRTTPVPPVESLGSSIGTTPERSVADCSSKPGATEPSSPTERSDASATARRGATVGMVAWARKLLAGHEDKWETTELRPVERAIDALESDLAEERFHCDEARATMENRFTGSQLGADSWCKRYDARRAK